MPDSMTPGAYSVIIVKFRTFGIKTKKTETSVCPYEAQPDYKIFHKLKLF